MSTGGLMMFAHGLKKLQNFGTMFHTFATPIGFSPELSYVLNVGAEFFCSLLLILGLFTRIAVIPLIINMIVIVCVVHLNDPWGKKEFGLLFLIPFLVIFLSGPGKYSLDQLLFNRKPINRFA